MISIEYDVILIYLPKPYLNEPDAQAPLGLMYLAAELEKAGKSVDIRNYAAYSDEEVHTDLPHACLYGITATSLEIPQANRFARLIRAKYPDASIVIGGPGSYANEFVDFDVVDSVCIGDGEKTIFNILEDAYTGTMDKIYYGEVITDLDSLELPARHLLKDRQGGNIFAYGHNYLEGGSTVILSSRGCPFKCAFCSAPKLSYNNKLRFRSPASVATEMKHVIDTYGIRQFRFSDDMFTANRKRVLELCDAIGPLNAVWRISCRVKPLDDVMLHTMWNAGCRELSFGIESFDNAVLAGLNKKATAEDNISALNRSAKVGYRTRMLFMIRTPFQTRGTIELNKHWIVRVPFDIMACTGFIPIPGSDVWYNPEKYNIEILDRDLDKYNFYMFNSEGRRPLDPIIKIVDRPLDEFMKESEEFRDWVEDLGKANKG